MKLMVQDKIIPQDFFIFKTIAKIEYIICKLLGCLEGKTKDRIL